MTYPGNPSLAGPVKDRVMSTFRQTLALYHQGRADEVVAGCNLLLQMDPVFDPAKKLLEKTRNPGAPIDVDSLLPVETAAQIDQARQAMSARDFQRVIQVTTDILTNDLMNDEARVLGDEAREKLEAAPFVDQFVRKCDQYLASGNLAAARTDIEKARALDATHPEVIRISKAIAVKEAEGPRAATPSFVVDDRAQQATGRAAAPASDFGFTFEEDKPAADSFSGFSFDTPAQSSSESAFANFAFDGGASAPPAAAPSGGFSFDTPAAAGNEFDFATAAVSSTPDDQQKIEQYLSDGDRAFDAGDYQQAIDLWSRIFLIDVTNDQASDRIERAKARRREIEGKVETLLGSAVAAFDRRDANRARAELTEVLRMDPGNVTAQDYLDRLNQGVEGGAAAAVGDFVPPPLEDKIDLGFFEDDAASSGTEASLVPPDTPPATAAKKGAPAKGKTAPAAGGRKLPMGAVLAVVALMVLGAGGWFVWNRFMSKPESDPAATQSIFQRASALAAQGKYDQAIAALQDIKPADPQHDKALEMIADLQQKKARAGETIGGMAPEEYFTTKVAAAQAAFAANDYAGAKAAFDEARKVKPLTAELQALYDAASDKLGKLDAAKALFAERKYADALASLQPLLQEDPQNQNIRRMINDAYFNLGAMALQEEKLDEAVRAFDEVLKADPNDEIAKRSRELALRYEGQTKDLLYKIYVKYLPLRQGT
jgi:tetratricopeptide (TPR) repeat protein